MNITDMFYTKRAKAWRREAGRLEIQAPHIPLVWVALSQRNELKEAVRLGKVKIVNLRARASKMHTVAYLELVEEKKS